MAKFLDVSSSNLYRDIRNMCINIRQQTILITGYHKSNQKQKTYQWVSKCQYDNGVLHIKLNKKLKTYLLNLNAGYTLYPYKSILAMKSVYAIRIYEIIMSKMIIKNIPSSGVPIEIKIEDIRKACDCENKFLKLSEFKRKVLDISAQEITNKTEYNVTYDNGEKEGKKILSIIFHVNYEDAMDCTRAGYKGNLILLQKE